MSQRSPAMRRLSVEGTRLLLDGQFFYWQGLSFFNALYNPTFNASADARSHWLRVFDDNGINALRVWCQWEFEPPRDFVDTDPAHTMYTPEGEIRTASFARLEALLEAVRPIGMVVEIVLFSHEKEPNLPVPAQERAVRVMAQRLLPHRDLLLQIWNEDSTQVARYFDAIKSIDPDRLVTNSPGFASDLGDPAQNRMLDLLTPHTARGDADRFWEVAAQQVAALLTEYGKPVIDDEPARTGTIQFGGISGGTEPWQHIAQIEAMRAVGGYHTYHHDMFQYAYGAPSTPPNGLPDPDYSRFHREVFDYLRDHRVWELEPEE